MLSRIKHAVAGAGDSLRDKSKNATKRVAQINEAQTAYEMKTLAHNRLLQKVLTDDPGLTGALTKSTNVLQRTPSQETLNIIFNHHPYIRSLAFIEAKREVTRASLHLNMLGQLSGEDLATGGLAATPIGSVSPSRRFSKSEILQLRGDIGLTEQEMGDHASKLGRNLYVQYRESYNCDATVTIGSTVVQAHKIMLAAFSEVLKRLYTKTNAAEKEMMEMDLKNLSIVPRALKKVIFWIYTGKLKLGTNKADVRDIAERLNMKQLLRVLNDQAAGPQVDEVPSSDTLNVGEGMGMELTKDEETKQAADALRHINQKTSMHNLTEMIEESKKDDELVDRDIIPMAIRLSGKAPKFGPGDLYAITAEVNYADLTAEHVYQLLSSDSIRVKSEVDVYEAAVKWLLKDFHQRRIYLAQLMDCPRWVYMSVNDMLRVRSYDKQFFHHKEVSNHVSRAKWYQDLLQRGVTWKEYRVPKNRIEISLKT